MELKKMDLACLNAFRVPNKPHYISRSKNGIKAYLIEKGDSISEAKKKISKWIEVGYLIPTKTNDNHYLLSDIILKQEKKIVCNGIKKNVRTCQGIRTISQRNRNANK